MAEELKPPREPTALPSAHYSAGLLRFKGHQAHSRILWPQWWHQSILWTQVQHSASHRTDPIWRTTPFFSSGPSPMNSTLTSFKHGGIFWDVNLFLFNFFFSSPFILPFPFCIQVGGRLCVYRPKDWHAKAGSSNSMLIILAFVSKIPNTIYREDTSAET